jgi:hypothetical protein
MIRILLIYAFCFNAFACTDKQECFPETSSTWWLFEHDKKIKLLSKKVEQLKLDVLKLHELKYYRSDIVKYLKYYQSTALIECNLLYKSSDAGGHWAAVDEMECSIRYYQDISYRLSELSLCINKSDPLYSKSCVYNFFKKLRKINYLI